MRKPQRNKAGRRQQISNFMSYPAPVGGWNALNALADMKPSEAVSLDNWFPRAGYCEIRGGSASHATAMTGTGKTLAVYSGLSGSDKMFCCTGSGVYNVSSAGSVGASVAARTSGSHQHVQFGDGTNNYLILLNGVDKPLYYDGSTWLAVDGASSPALTGVTTTKLVHVCAFKGRLIFLETGSLKFWYLAAGAAGGALTAFDLSGVAQLGGYLISIGTWTADSGSGPDDRLVLVTSNGEVIIYEGTNPSAAATWALVGNYQVGHPLGRNCLIKVGSDMVILTRDGIFPLTTILNSTGLDYSKAVTYKIQTAFNDAALNYGANLGWKATSFPNQSAVIINIPVAVDGTHYQYVMNSITNSWCRFIGWDAEDFTVFNNELYYCQGTAVIKAWTGYGDQGANIDAYAKTAFSYFKQPGQLKDFKMFRPVLLVNGAISFLMDIDVDFEDLDIYGIAVYSSVSTALWDTALWDVDLWQSEMQLIKKWNSPSTFPGYCASGKIKISVNDLNVQWVSCDYMYETGNGL